eukprot:m.186240 g.186240  ORF g.186240 m.186240 type:complete len:460 (+) comp17507_c0_seq4:3832-5211(+)
MDYRIFLGLCMLAAEREREKGANATEQFARLFFPSAARTERATPRQCAASQSDVSMRGVDIKTTRAGQTQEIEEGVNGIAMGDLDLGWRYAGCMPSSHLYLRNLAHLCSAEEVVEEGSEADTALGDALVHNRVGVVEVVVVQAGAVDDALGVARGVGARDALVGAVAGVGDGLVGEAGGAGGRAVVALGPLLGGVGEVAVLDLVGQGRRPGVLRAAEKVRQQARDDPLVPHGVQVLLVAVEVDGDLVAAAVASESHVQGLVDVAEEVDEELEGLVHGRSVGQLLPARLIVALHLLAVDALRVVVGDAVAHQGAEARRGALGVVGNGAGHAGVGRRLRGHLVVPAVTRVVEVAHLVLSIDVVQRGRPGILRGVLHIVSPGRDGLHGLAVQDLGDGIVGALGEEVLGHSGSDLMADIAPGCRVGHGEDDQHCSHTESTHREHGCEERPNNLQQREAGRASV